MQLAQEIEKLENQILSLDDIQANKPDVIIKTIRLENKVKVSIQDSGIGIPPSHHDKIFERFFRVTTPSVQTFPGMGLGLYITAGIIQRHKGTISVESEPGVGSTFSFILPDTSDYNKVP